MSSKTLLLAALKKKFPDVDEKALAIYAKQMAKNAENTIETESDADSAVEDITIQSVIDSYVDSLSNKAAAKAVASYEQKYGIKEGKIATRTSDNSDEEEDAETNDAGKVNKKVTQPKDISEMPAWAKAIIDSNKAMGEELKKLKGEKVANERLDRISQTIKDTPELYRSMVSKMTKRMNMEGMTDEEFEDTVTDIQDLYGSISSQGAESTPAGSNLNNQAAARKNLVGAPKGGGTSGANSTHKVNPYVAERIEAIKTQEAPPAIQGLPQSITTN